jgi:hypothetical protein
MFSSVEILEEFVESSYYAPSQASDAEFKLWQRVLKNRLHQKAWVEANKDKVRAYKHNYYHSDPVRKAIICMKNNQAAKARYAAKASDPEWLAHRRAIRNKSKAKRKAEKRAMSTVCRKVVAKCQT